MSQPGIVLVHYSSSPGGIEVILPQIIERLPQYSYSAFIIRPPHPGISVYKKDLPVSLHYGSFNSIAAGIKLFIYAFKNRGSVFHVFNIGPFFLLMLRLAGVRSLIYSIHGTQYWKNGIERCVFRFLWRVSMSGDYIITANSKFSRDVFINRVLSSREITLLYNPIDYERFKPSESRIRSQYPHRIIYCGRLDKEKNLDQWIRIANLVLQKMPDILFELYGEGSQLPHLQNMINNYKINDRIILKGFTSEPEKAMQEADLLMFLSSYESFGNVVVESILCGTPVIAGDIPAMKEIFGEYPCFMVSINEDTGAEILLKLQNIGELNVRAMEARETFKERFSPEKHFHILEELYNSLLYS